MKAETTLTSTQLADAVALYLGARLNAKILAKNIEIIVMSNGITKVNINIPDQGIASSRHVGSGGSGGTASGHGVGGVMGVNSQAMGMIVAPGVNISYANGQFSGSGVATIQSEHSVAQTTAMPQSDTNSVYQTDIDFASVVNEQLAGKTIKSAKPVDTHCPVHEVEITFMDGTIATIQSEHDEGFVIWMD